ncbi:GTP-binding protein Rhes-like 1, partial [Homarus americanus]
FLNNKFDDTYTPTIEDFHRKLYRIRGDVYQLDILDTSGNHPFPAMRRLSFLTGDLFVLVFSWDSRDSWNEVLRLREQILETKQSASANTTGSRKKRAAARVPMVIAGNKCDREQRGVALEEVQKFVSSLSCCAYVETSAKKDNNVDKLFYELFVLANLPME